jgi:hypothetical protein
MRCSSECGEKTLGSGSHDHCCPTLQRGPRAVPAVLLSAGIPIAAGWKAVAVAAAASPLLSALGVVSLSPLCILQYSTSEARKDHYIFQQHKPHASQANVILSTCRTDDTRDRALQQPPTHYTTRPLETKAITLAGTLNSVSSLRPSVGGFLLPTYCCTTTTLTLTLTLALTHPADSTSPPRRHHPLPLHLRPVLSLAP